MTSFFRDMADNGFLLTGLLAGLLSSVACGIIGPYVVTRRIVFLAGAIAHAAVGGIGIAIWLRHVQPGVFGWLSPLHGAIVVALAGAIFIGRIVGRGGERTDTMIGAMWAVGMSVGILLLKFTPGYHTELPSYLFGNIAFVAWADVWLIVALDAVIVVSVLALHKRILALCLDEEHALLQGVDVRAANTVLLVLVALAVICLIQVVGLILVLALLTLPAATSAFVSRRLAPMMLISVALCAGLTTLPRIAVYGTRISPESSIVLAAAAVYVLTRLLTRRAELR